ncbi:hypothetical protein AXF42_Ash007222 [Apostasia shenzhenica]|uniref:TOD1/MUCI70 glycosyltransferase-like domain-containing protein n=1 Tax=Apostasia shenzhenica TaxID=1088818 RepID=A0A2I0B9L6_9ASPA|nr:hypothetical protein AXF42_Ash007222 [Apostasia shenzhenica]
MKERSHFYEIIEFMHVHCGFVKGERPGKGTGFDINDKDLLACSSFPVNFYILQQPTNISKVLKRNVCSYMFVDERTKAEMRNHTTIGVAQRAGLCWLVVIHNVLYVDPRCKERF